MERKLIIFRSANISCSEENYGLLCKKCIIFFIFLGNGLIILYLFLVKLLEIAKENSFPATSLSRQICMYNFEIRCKHLLLRLRE